MKLKAVALFTALTATAIISSPSYSAEWTGYRNIRELGCHINSGTCFVTIDGNAAIGGGTCTNVSIRWNGETDPNGKSIFAMLMSAKALGKRVGFYVTGCYPEQAWFPTFAYAISE